MGNYGNKLEQRLKDKRKQEKWQKEFQTQQQNLLKRVNQAVRDWQDEDNPSHEVQFPAIVYATGTVCETNLCLMQMLGILDEGWLKTARDDMYRTALKEGKDAFGRFRKAAERLRKQKAMEPPAGNDNSNKETGK